MQKRQCRNESPVTGPSARERQKAVAAAFGSARKIEMAQAKALRLARLEARQLHAAERRQYGRLSEDGEFCFNSAALGVLVRSRPRRYFLRLLAAFSTTVDGPGTGMRDFAVVSIIGASYLVDLITGSLYRMNGASAVGSPLRVRIPRSRSARWLLCQRSLVDGERQYYFSNLPPTTALTTLVRIARSRMNGASAVGSPLRVRIPRGFVFDAPIQAAA